MIFGEGPIIKNIAGDLNKLFLQGTRAGQPINNVEGDAAADQGTVQLMAARDPVIQEISVGMSGEQSARYTVSGTPPLSLPNSLGKPLKAWSVDVLPYQDLHGYSNPWPAGGGTNKAKLDNTYNTTSADFSYAKISEEETIAVANVSGRFILTYVAQVEANATYTFSCDYANGTYGMKCYVYKTELYGTIVISDQSVPFQFTPTESGLVVIGIYYQSGRPTGTEIKTGKYQLTQGSTAVAWTPYSNICPIYGTDKLNLFVEESYDQSATPKAVLTLPQTVYTGTIGSEGGESRWGEVDLGTLTWVSEESESIGLFRVADTITLLGGAKYFSAPMCEILVGTMPKTYSLIENGTICFSNSELYPILRARDESFIGKTGAQIKTLMSGFKMIFELKTPTPYTLTSPTIPTPTGTATTWATAEDGILESMEVTYIKSE